MIDRVVKRNYFNTSTERVSFEITSEPCQPRTQAARAALLEILEQCCQNQNFLFCDAELMERATLIHDGIRWVLRGEALVTKPMENT